MLLARKWSRSVTLTTAGCSETLVFSVCAAEMLQFSTDYRGFVISTILEVLTDSFVIAPRNDESSKLY